MEPRFIFIGAQGRSGTGILRRMLDCHSQIASGPEFGFLREINALHIRMRAYPATALYLTEYELKERFAAFIRSLLAPYAMQRGKPVLVEKTPSNVWAFPFLSELFPDAKFVHLVRDGRDVVASHLEVGRRAAARGAVVDSASKDAVVDPCFAAALWARTVKEGETHCDPQTPLSQAGRATSVRYEDLLRTPEQEMRRLLEFIGVPYEEAVLHPERAVHDAAPDGMWLTVEDLARPLSTDSIGNWRKRLPLDQRMAVALVAHETLKRWGYATDMSWISDGLSVSAEEVNAAFTEARAALDRYKAPAEQG